MAYVDPNFKTKKALRDAIKAGAHVSVYSPGSYPCEQNGTLCVEGPHYPAPHTWYARVHVIDGMVNKVFAG